MTKFLTLIFIVILAKFPVCNAQTLGFHFKNNNKKIKIPFELYNNLILVPVILNHQLPLKFVIDTGVRTAILTDKIYADILNLTYQKKYVITGIGDKEKEGIEAYVTSGVSISMPSFEGNGHALLVLKDDYLELKNHLGTEVHGILGYELFSRYVVKIDYNSRILTISKPKNFRKKRGYEKIALSIEDTKPYIMGELEYSNQNPIEVKLMVDTGASHGLMLKTDTIKNIFIPKKHVSANIGRGLAGTLHGKISRVHKFRLTKKEWSNIIVTFPDKNEQLDSLTGDRSLRNGSIGGEILSRYNVIFNYPNEAIYLKKNTKFNRPFEYNLSGIHLKATGSNLRTFEVTEIRANSTAENAGVKTGDIILSINNIASEELNLELIAGFLNQRVNKTINLKLKRDNEIIKTKFKLKSEI